MLVPRIITALCLIPLVLWAVIGLDSFYFALLSAVIFALGALEWAGLCEFHSKRDKILYILCFFICIGLMYWIDNSLIILLIGSLLWCAPVLWIFTYKGFPPSLKGFPPSLLESKFPKAIIGILALSFAWYGLVVIQRLPTGSFWVILLFILVWSADTFAFFVGRKWGSEPLSPAISPKKTIAGFWGGIIGTMLLAFGLTYLHYVKPFAHIMVMPHSAWLSIAYLIFLLAVLGDLFESLIKRLAGVKDSGQLLPGHGGILDRIDSLIAALPLYALSLVWVTT